MRTLQLQQDSALRCSSDDDISPARIQLSIKSRKRSVMYQKDSAPRYTKSSNNYLQIFQKNTEIYKVLLHGLKACNWRLFSNDVESWLPVKNSFLAKNSSGPNSPRCHLNRSHVLTHTNTAQKCWNYYTPNNILMVHQDVCRTVENESFKVNSQYQNHNENVIGAALASVPHYIEWK